MADTKKKAPLNCRNFTAWAMTDEDEETYSQTPVSLAGKTMNFTDSLTVNTTDLSGDGVIADTATGVGKGQLTVGIHDLTDSERVTFFGETLQNGAVVTTGRESSPALCVALVTDCATDGSVVNLSLHPCRMGLQTTAIWRGLKICPILSGSSVTMPGWDIRSKDTRTMRAIMFFVSHCLQELTAAHSKMPDRE